MIAPPAAEHRTLAKTRRFWALAPASLPIVALVGAVYLLLSYVPVGGPTLWGALNYGDWILAHRAVPAEDPMLPLAEGMTVVDIEWLSQVILSGLNGAGGAWWLSQFFALIGAVTLAILSRVFFLNTGSRLLSAAGGLSVLLLGWRGWTVGGPESLGLLGFAVLLWLIADPVPDDDPETRRGRSLWLWVGMPALFLLWTNLHGSFVYGLGLLVCGLIGRLAEVGWRMRSLGALVADRATREWLYRLELACAATLLNPHGLDALVHALWAGPQESLRTLPSWQPLVVQGLGGWMFAGSIAVLMVALRLSRRPLPVAHGLLLALFAGSAARWVGMLTWYAPVFALVTLPLLSGVRTGAGQGAERAAEPGRGTGAETGWALLTRRSWHSSLVAALLLWATFSFSTVGGVLLRGEVRTRAQLLPADTPVALAAYLDANPPAGQIFNPWWWGDWLVREGPGRLQPFATSRLELLPARVWRDYRHIEMAGPGWSRALERYRIGTVVVDKNRQPGLRQTMGDASDWRLLHEDDLAAVFAATAPEGAAIQDETRREAPAGDGVSHQLH